MVLGKIPREPFAALMRQLRTREENSSISFSTVVREARSLLEIVVVGSFVYVFHSPRHRA